MKKGSEILFEALNDLPDELILRADPINYANSRRKKTARLAWAACIALVLVSAALVTVLFTRPAATVPSSISSGTNAPLQFYYQDNLYVIYQVPMITTTLPEGYNFLADVINVGGEFSGTNYEGNFDGKIYLNNQDKAQAYVEIPGKLYQDGITRYVYFTVRDQSE